MTGDKKIFRVDAILELINKACDRSGRKASEVTLMAVSKTRTAEEVEAMLGCGIGVLGENRVQEGADKRGRVVAPAQWELIGPLQSNKVRQAVEHFDRVQTVDRVKLVQKLDRCVEELGHARYPVLMQVNIGADPAKHGCSEDEAPELLEAILAARHLRLDGLMTIGEYTEDERVLRRTFGGLRTLRDRLSDTHAVGLPVLSMGMSADMAIAIEEGSTLVRVGTALFGVRE